jgi:hypothetical protein
MSNHYQAINIEEKKEDYKLGMAKRREEREEIERNKPFCERYVIQATVCVIILIIVGFITIYVFSILLGTLVIVSNYLFETTMVALYGRATYNKNFPICYNDIYKGSNCYTRTSTYCS